jgi:ribosomal protein S4
MYFIWKIETRVDTILYRLNLQANTFFIRQYIKHVGLFVNDIFLNLPSFRLKFKDYLKLINKKQIFRFILYKFFKKLIFTSIPYYYEVNHRLMTMLFFFKPVNKMIFFPFEINIELLAGLGERF